MAIMAFETNIKNIYGAQGEAWLNKLPELVGELAKKYGLTNLKPVDNLSYNYVLSGFQDKRSIILKLSLDEKGLKKEAAALKAFAKGKHHQITHSEWAWVAKTADAAAAEGGSKKSMNLKEFTQWINEFAAHFGLCHH